MDALLLGVGIGFGLLVLSILAWRMLSRRHELPCPAAFIWMLENRIMENVAGSAELIRRAEITSGMHILDAGCGPGRVSLPVAAYIAPDGMVTALDVQAGMLARLKERARQAGVDNLETIHAGLGDGQLPEATFDRVLLVTVLGEIPNQVQALKEVYSALRPGGMLSITEVLPDPHYQSRRKVSQLGKECGFTVTEAYVGRRAFTLNLIKPLN